MGFGGQEIHSSHVPGLENGDIDLPFPMFSRLGEV